MVSSRALSRISFMTLVVVLHFRRSLSRILINTAKSHRLSSLQKVQLPVNPFTVVTRLLSTLEMFSQSEKCPKVPLVAASNTKSLTLDAALPSVLLLVVVVSTSLFSRLVVLTINTRSRETAGQRFVVLL